MPPVMAPSPITRDNVIVLLLRSRPYGITQSGRNRCRAVCGAKGSYSLSLRLVKSTVPRLAKGANAVPADRSEFVRVTLMTNVPDQFVVGYQNIVNGGGQLDHT